MTQNPGPELPPPPPTYGQLPPPPGYPYGYDPYRPQPVAAPEPRRNSGVLGWLTGLIAAGAAAIKYAFVIVPYGKTLITLLISFGAYAVFFGPWFAAALVGMILIHEFGHVIEIKRQGLEATAPIFIPFVGAAIFQRSHPQDAMRQAQIGIAGPLLGTVGAVAAYVLFGSTHFAPFLIAAWIGFYINLLNLIPIGMLDGGWILAPVSKWFQVVGFAILIALIFTGQVSPIFLIFILLSLPTIIGRFRNADSEYYTKVPVAQRWAMGLAWLALVVFLAFADVQAQQQLNALVPGLR